MRLLLTLTLCGSMLALLLLWLRYVLLRRMPSTVYYYAWLLVLLRFVLPVPGLIPTAGETNTPEAPVYRETYIQDFDDPISLYTPSMPMTAGVPAAVAEQQAAAQETQQTESQRPAAAPKTAFTVDWRSPELWLAVWGLGAALSLGTTVLAYLRFTRKLRRELHRPDRFTCACYDAIPGRKPRLFTSAAVKTPLMYGVFSPKIVLPERSYDEELLHNILRHELMHYRRLDTLYKWAAAVVLSAHWFNPLSWLIRRELNRACELSCDEMLLRAMTRQEKQSYGNTLLSMAASAALPAGVVATTFSTEKRNLKERLVQIMKYKKSGARMLAAVLALVLLAGFGLVMGPASAKAADDPAEGEVRRVTTVDELLAAIAPNTVIELAEGVYDLSTAADYGEDSHSAYYSWNGVWGEKGENPAELVIANVDGLTIRGAGMEKSTLAAVPRYANVIRFVNCHALTLEDFTAGHTTEPGFCMGGVLRLESCGDVSVTGCGLFGCGTVGVDAVGCTDLTVSASRIYECSYNAVSVRQCRNVLVENCEIDSHGVRPGQGEAMSLFTAEYTDGFSVHGCEIHGNAAQYLLSARYSKNALFLSNDVHDNRIASSVFIFDQYAAVVDGCRFETNDFRFWVPDHRFDPIDVNGEPLEEAELNEMTLRDIDPAIAVTPVPVEKAADVRPGESIVVTTVDEFLKAIGPDRTILLDGELFDLSTAANYGSAGGEYYFWQESYDGPQLVIQNVSGLSIGAVNADNTATTLAAIPRYANVISFRDCDNLMLFGFTAGHTKEPGSCSGGVLWFQNCHKVTVDQMRLYGCGILGLQTSQCTDLLVRQTEIYECSQGAGQFFQTDGIAFENCDIHDVPSPALVFTESGDKSWNSEPISGLSGSFDVDEAGALKGVGFEESNADTPRVGRIDELVNPFANEPTHTYHAGTPQAEFAAAVQRSFVDGDWESLADKICYPLPVFTPEYTYHMWTREEFMSSVENENFMRNAFNDEYRARIGAADLSEFGDCAFGETTCGHLIAFTLTGSEPTAENIKITAISLKMPFWPGQNPYVQVTPEP